MTHKEILRLICELSHAGNTRDFARLVEKAHPSDTAEALAELPVSTTLTLLKQLRDEVAAELFGYFPEALQTQIFHALPPVEAARLFEHLPSDERADFYALLPPQDQQSLLAALSEDVRRDLIRLSAFSEESTGSVATSEYISVLPETRVAAALKTVRAVAGRCESIYVVYVLDREQRLLGAASLRDLLLADDGELMENVMRRHPVCARASWPRERAAEMIRRYDLLALPVTDEHNRMLGVITVDDAMDVEKEQDASQLARFGGTATAGDAELDLLKSPLFSMFKVRAFWLIFLTVFGVVTSNFVAAQEEILSRVIVLAAFIAPIVDMGGNTGSQSATLVIRAMAEGDVTLGMTDLWRVLRRELPVACALGLTVALLEGSLAWVSKGVDAPVLLTVGLSMFVCTASGGVIGLALPFLARRMGTDPATLSSPLITSVMDLLGVFIYFGFAYLFLGDALAAALQ